MSDSHYLITGVASGVTAGAIAPNRIEINDFVKIKDQFSLYIQALQAMSSVTQDDLLSFFQIGGIHGLPYIPWDDSGKAPVSDQGWEGYCTHGSVLFPVWHRPYVVLYEQVLQRTAAKIADTYVTDKARFQAAAANLRQPYWDWAANSVPPDEVIAMPQVTIITPDGQNTTVDNPLYQYRFHPIDPSFPDPYSGWQTTLRHPTDTSPDAEDNIAELKSTLSSVQDDVTSKTYNLLSRVSTWPAFSNHTPDDGGSASNSLEGIHDGIHVDVGGQGQMADPSVAGFDPIFFLHHSQVDRLVSLWHALHPDVWVTNGPQTDGTWTIDPNATVGDNSALTPFWNTQTSYWAGADLKDTTKLGYSYPEFNGLDLGNKDAVRTAITQIVNQLYGGQGGGGVQRSDTAFTTEALAAPPAIQQPTAPAAPAPTAGDNDQLTFSVAPSSQAPAGNAVWDWVARVHVQKFALGSSFSVLVFLGEVPASPAEWRTSPSFVGSHSAFVNSSAGRCANCRTQGDAVTEGFIHLNNGIARRSGLPSLDPDVVEPYLRQNLHWRILKVDGTAVDLASVESLEVTVFATPQTPPSHGGAFPVSGEPSHRPHITHGKPGGAKAL